MLIILFPSHYLVLGPCLYFAAVFFLQSGIYIACCVFLLLLLASIYIYICFREACSVSVCILCATSQPSCLFIRSGSMAAQLDTIYGLSDDEVSTVGCFFPLLNVRLLLFPIEMRSKLLRNVYNL